MKYRGFAHPDKTRKINIMAKVFLAVPTGEMARRADFYDSYNQLRKPEGTICSFSHGQSPAKNRNIMIDMAIENSCSHILFLDDDMIPEPDLIERLLSHDKDVVSALYLMRNFPHLPVIFDESYKDGQCKFMFLDPSKSGLVPIVNCGLGAVLISTRIFTWLDKPFIRLGEIFQDEWCDDVGFFNRVRASGFEMFCDLGAKVGHSLNVTITPEFKNGYWFTNYKDGNGTFNLSQTIPDKEVIEQQIKELVTL